jgi:hypothetical protein
MNSVLEHLTVPQLGKTLPAFYEANVHYSPPHVPVLGQINPVHALSVCLL